jgi:hypothetical protein
MVPKKTLRPLRILLFAVIALAGLRPSALASDIDACKYLIVTDFTSDPYGIAAELRAQGRTNGFTISHAPTEINDHGYE